MSQLSIRKMLSFSMDVPNVNCKFIQRLQNEHSDQFGGVQSPDGWELWASYTT